MAAAAILKIGKKLQYLRNKKTILDEIWYSDAYCPSEQQVGSVKIGHFPLKTRYNSKTVQDRGIV